MNLKESFRYLNFLDKMLESARMSVNDPSHCLKTTKTHLKKTANPEAENVVEVVEVDNFFETDMVINEQIPSKCMLFTSVYPKVYSK